MRRVLFYSFLLVFCFCVAPAISKSEKRLVQLDEDGNYIMVVINEDGEVEEKIELATLEIDCEEGTRIYLNDKCYGVTDEDDTLLIEKLLPEMYEVKAVKLGYETTKKKIRLREGDEESLRIRLREVEEDDSGTLSGSTKPKTRRGSRRQGAFGNNH